MKRLRNQKKNPFQYMVKQNSNCTFYVCVCSLVPIQKGLKYLNCHFQVSHTITYVLRACIHVCIPSFATLFWYASPLSKNILLLSSFTYLYE